MTIADSLRHLGLSAPDARPDGELVGQYARTRDEGAFVELLRRHGPAVYGVCRRVVGNGPDAEDAFQAVFLVLARKAGTIGEPGLVGNWLYGVAVRTANKARVMNAKEASRRRPPGLHPAEPVAASAGPADGDTFAVVDAELAALPGQYRAAFVTCVLNGRSRSDAARELGWPEGTVAARVAKARELLAARLRKRGVAPAAGALAAAAVPPATAAAALNAVRELWAAGTASAVAPAAQSLSDEVVKTMTTSGPKWLAAAGVLAAALTTGGALLLAAGADEPPPVREPAKAPVPTPKDGPAGWTGAKSIELDGRRITGVAYSPDGKLIALAQDDKLTVLEADTRRRKYAIGCAEPGTYTAVAFNPKGDKLAVTRKDAVDVWDAATGKGVETWALTGFDPHQVIWFTDPDGGEHLVATNGDGTRHRYPNGREEAYTGWAVFRHQPCVLAAVPGRNGWLMQFDHDKDPRGTADFWLWTPADTGRCRRLTGHPYRQECAAVSGDGKVIVTGDGAGHVLVWDGDTFGKKAVVECEGGVKSIAITRDGKTTAVFHGIGHAPKTALPILPDQTKVTVDLMVTLYDTVALARSDKAAPKPLLSWKTDKPLPGGRGGPVSLAFSPDGKTLLAAFADPFNYPPLGDERTAAKAEPSMGVRVWEWAPKK
ncbi:MAG TPA: sigma factor-like helix-turn-helix DNA-binding protein [Urbifossiella sp.]|jgi:RNA polymerase sigma factor (sigma-70 family)|nr:sigma factor-like helix-turn-helix DNA-binding protein [Urbifossiella sp.]